MEEMQASAETRERWEQMKHLYVLTLPDSLIFSYKTLSRSNSLEKSILEMINPMESNGDSISFEFVTEKYKKFLEPNGSLRYPDLPKGFFLEKLLTVIDDRYVNEKILQERSEKFDNGKGYEITLGKCVKLLITNKSIV